MATAPNSSRRVTSHRGVLTVISSGSDVIATSSPRPSSTCRSTALKHAFVQPPANHRKYGASPVSTSVSHGVHVSSFTAVLVPLLGATNASRVRQPPLPRSHHHIVEAALAATSSASGDAAKPETPPLAGVLAAAAALRGGIVP